MNYDIEKIQEEIFEKQILEDYDLIGKHVEIWRENGNDKIDVEKGFYVDRISSLEVFIIKDRVVMIPKHRIVQLIEIIQEKNQTKLGGDD